MNEPYINYLTSPEWRDKKRAALRRAGYRCQVCNADRWFCRLHVHHRTYENLGHERPGDLTVLCSGCHRLFHRHRKLSQ